MEVEHIVDSGERRQWSTGAQRDMANKGRCDLLPWDIIGDLYNGDTPIVNFCKCLERAINYLNLSDNIKTALHIFIEIQYNGNIPTAMLDNAFHFEAGAKKYSDNNWRSGIPVKVYLDSAGRHFLKYLRGDSDEHHDRAVVWNLICALWTIKHKPEMIDAPMTGV